MTRTVSCRGGVTLGKAQGASEPPLELVVVGVTVVVVVVGWVWVCVVSVSVVVVVGTDGAVRVIVVVFVVFEDESPPPVISRAAMTPATMIATPAMTHGHGFESRGGGAPYPPCCG